MLSATLYHLNKGKDYLKGTPVVLEWLAFLTLNAIGWIGPSLPDITDNANIKFIWLCIVSRQLYGACLAYLILLCISANEDTNPIPWYRPTRWIKGFLCMNIWLPIATFSYSMYIWHLRFLDILGPILTGVFGL